ncbi:uncharacterized protein LOC143039801 [Oratosquilla oratoria]|uniref:uncharacterized protein LOC143039801 n=1 Tax=Oratosquilla oratoria TaxID=337810 RepID=UPI003F75D63A
MENIEARSVIKFLHLKGYSARQIHDEMKAVYGDDCLSYDSAVRWKKNFQTGHMFLTDEPRTGPKAKVQKSAGKVMLLVFWDCRGVILTDYLTKGQTIASAYYCTLLNKLRDAVKKKRRGMLIKGIRLFADSAPAHSSQGAVVEARCPKEERLDCCVVSLWERAVAYCQLSMCEKMCMKYG